MNNMNTKMKSQQLVKMAMMAALACVVGLIRFPLIPAVSFLTYDFADIPILITTFAFVETAFAISTDCIWEIERVPSFALGS